MLYGGSSLIPILLAWFRGKSVAVEVLAQSIKLFLLSINCFFFSFIIGKIIIIITTLEELIEWLRSLGRRRFKSCSGSIAILNFFEAVMVRIYEDH